MPQSGSGAASPTDAGIRLPGLMSAAIIALLAGVACWFWLTTLVARQAPLRGRQLAASALAQVAPGEVAGALTTMSGSGAFLARFRAQKDACPQPLAWVTLVRTAGQPASTVRLRSGDYVSPVFRLSDNPVRIAIPYPAPYSAGHGVLMLYDAGGGATVALYPAWRIVPLNGTAERSVIWTPGRRCPAASG